MQQNEEQKNGLSWSAPQSQQSSQSQLQRQPAPAQKALAPVQPKLSPAQSSAGKYVALLVTGVIAGVLIAWTWSAMRSSGTPVATSTATSTAQIKKQTEVPKTALEPQGGEAAAAAPGAAEGSDSSLMVMNLQAPGDSVAIAKAVVSSPTWVVVYEDNSGKPGNALGAALFFPDKQSGSVELLRPTVSGKSYLITKQVDNGDRKFSLKGDLPLTEGGVQMWVTLQVQ